MEPCKGEHDQASCEMADLTATEACGPCKVRLAQEAENEELAQEDSYQRRTMQGRLQPPDF